MFLDSIRVLSPLAGALDGIGLRSICLFVPFRVFEPVELSINIASRSQCHIVKCFENRRIESIDGPSRELSTVYTVGPAARSRTSEMQCQRTRALSSRYTTSTSPYLPSRKNVYGHDKQVLLIYRRYAPNERSSRTYSLQEMISVVANAPKAATGAGKSSAPRSEILCRKFKYYWTAR